MPTLAWAKRRVASRLSSVALKADAAETQLRTYLSAVVLLGLAASALVGWWWMDPIAGLSWSPRSQSLANIRVNPNVAVTVSSRSPFDLYLQGEGDAEMLDNDEQLEAAKHAVRAKAPEIELLKFRAAAVRLTIRHWRATDVTIGWRPGKELMQPVKPSPN